MDMKKLKELNDKSDMSIREAAEKLDRIAFLQTLDADECADYFEYLNNNKEKLCYES